MPDTSPQRSHSLELSLGSSPQEIRAALDRVRRALRDAGWDDEARGTAELVLAEALNNIVEHAYGSAGDGQIRLSVVMRGRTAELVICDGGGVMPGRRLPEGAPPRLDVGTQELPEGGFGWHLIRRLSDHLNYRHDDGRNRLEIRIRAEGEASQD